MPSGRLDAVVPPAPTGRRAEVLGDLASQLVALNPGERVLVALDGVDGAGKTVLGRELATLVAPHREVHRVSVDGFHRPRSQRYAHGRTPETFYRDSYDTQSKMMVVGDGSRSLTRVTTGGQVRGLTRLTTGGMACQRVDLSARVIRHPHIQHSALAVTR